VPDYRLLVFAVAFLLIVLWRVRPALSDDDEPPPVRGLDTAKDDDERAELLAAAGDTMARSLVGARRAASCYARAMRLRPGSVALAARAAKGLARSPRVLEALVWRRLGAGPWTGPAREVAEALVAQLVTVYDASSKTRPRARALEHMLAALAPKAAPAPEKAAREAAGAPPAAEHEGS